MQKLWITSLVLASMLIGCKPTANETENLRNQANANGKTETQSTEETTFAQWTGRSDLKGSWTFENVP